VSLCDRCDDGEPETGAGCGATSTYREDVNRRDENDTLEEVLPT